MASLHVEAIFRYSDLNTTFDVANSENGMCLTIIHCCGSFQIIFDITQQLYLT